MEASHVRRFWLGRRRERLLFEIAIFFIGFPLLIAAGCLPRRPIVFVITGAICAWAVLRPSSSFRWREMWYGNATKNDVRFIALRSFLLAIPLAALVIAIDASQLFSFPLRFPARWLLVTCLYPFLSALPQEIIFRGLFFARYRELLPSDRAAIVASAFLFAFAHIIFFSWVTVVLSFAGGLFMAQTYVRTRSLALVSFEHALLGLAVFTLGLGRYFFHAGFKIQ